MRDDDASNPAVPAHRETLDWERRKLKLTLLEGRRSEIDGYMWQAPALTLVAQAFLLRVLTDRGVGCAVATAVAVAGALATVTAALALWILHDREYDFGKRVERQARLLGLGPIRRLQTSRRGSWNPLEVKGYVVWSVALGSFVVADAIALADRHGGWAVAIMIVAVAVACLGAFWFSAAVTARDRSRQERMQARSENADEQAPDDAGAGGGGLPA
jgi:hypothetical protein